MDEADKNIKKIFNFQKAFRLIILEFAGTMALTYGLLCSQRNNYLAGMSLIAPLFLISDLTGSYFNSAITLISMVKPRSMGRISIRSGLIDILIHIIGGICSGLFCLLVLEDFISPIYLYHDSSWLLADFFGEILGTFTFISFVLVQTNTQTKFTNDRVWGALIIVMGFVMGRTFTFHSGGVLNPGVALGIQISNSIIEGGSYSMSNVWIFLIGPLLGGLLSLVFYVKIYQPNLKAKIFQRKSKLIVENNLETQESKN
jgi:glycerol uptake facilitator-like aquaporin